MNVWVYSVENLTHSIDVPSAETFNTVMNSKNGISSINGVSDERPDGRIHPASWSTDMHYGESVTFLVI